MTRNTKPIEATAAQYVDSVEYPVAFCMSQGWPTGEFLPIGLEGQTDDDIGLIGDRPDGGFDLADYNGTIVNDAWRWNGEGCLADPQGNKVTRFKILGLPDLWCRLQAEHDEDVK